MICIAVVLCTIPHAANPQNAPVTADTARTVINQYCVTCHNTTAKTAGLTLDTMNVANVAENAEAWEKVIKKVRAGMMPPQGKPRPDQHSSDVLVSWLRTSLDRAAAG